MALPLTIEGYAAVMAELFAAGDGRAAVLARHGLDEDAWDATDRAYQQQLSDALDVEGGEGPLLSAFSAAYSEAQRALGPPITLEAFAEVTRLLRGGVDLPRALARASVPLHAYVQGSAHWSERIAREPEVTARFEAALRAR